MSIHAISGKPGAGKSMYAVKLLIEELLYGSRTVVTNLPLNLGAINEYIQREHPEKDVDIFARVRLLDDDQTGEFWTYRPNGRDCWHRIPRCSAEDWREGKKPSYAGTSDNGVWYCIDECHNFFNARAWQETGRDVLFYLSQHRKLGDTVVWVTQAVDNVDKQFRSVTQDYTYIRNLTKERMGLFRLPAIFVRRTFGEKAGPNSSPMETGSFRLDVRGIASLYDTARGVGIHNRGNADKTERRSGIHWMWFAVGLPIVIVALFILIPKVGAHLFGSSSHIKAVSSHVESPALAPAIAKTNQPGREVSSVTEAPTEPLTNRVDMVGYAVRPKLYADQIVRKIITVHLSDGSTFRSGDGHLQYLCEDYCVVDGRTNVYRPVVVPQAPIQMGPVVPPDLLAQAPADSSEKPGVSVYVMPYSHNSMARPSVRDAVSRGGVSLGY